MCGSTSISALGHREAQLTAYLRLTTGVALDLEVREDAAVPLVGQSSPGTILSN